MNPTQTAPAPLLRYEFGAIGHEPFYTCYCADEAQQFKAILLKNGLPFALKTYNFSTRETETVKFN